MKLKYRSANLDDLKQLVYVLTHEQCREMVGLKISLDKSYTRIFKAIDNDPNNHIILAESNGHLVGLLQLTFVPYLISGSWHCLIGKIKIKETFSDLDFSEQIIDFAITAAEIKGCEVLHLTNSANNISLQPIYEKFGFESDNQGMKLTLN